MNASKFQEMPSIPVCRYSIPMKSSPKPARIAPTDRVLPFATSHRRAPTPRMGRAAAEMLTRKPKIATSHGVEVVPSVAPMMTPIACANVSSPALTKPMTVRIAAVEDCTSAVKTTPDTIALNRPEISLCSALRSESPARSFRPSVRWWMPSRNRPRPPRRVTADKVFMDRSPGSARATARRCVVQAWGEG